MTIEYTNTLSVRDYCMLRQSVGFYAITDEQVQRALRKSDFVVVASAKGAPVGMARLISDGTQALVMDVIVHPDYQNNGIGRGLMDRIVAYFEQQKTPDMLINLLTDSTKVAFYEKLGYHQTEGIRLHLKSDQSAHNREV